MVRTLRSSPPSSKRSRRWPINQLLLGELLRLTLSSNSLPFAKSWPVKMKPLETCALKCKRATTVSSKTIIEIAISMSVLSTNDFKVTRTTAMKCSLRKSVVRLLKYELFATAEVETKACESVIEYAVRLAGEELLFSEWTEHGLMQKRSLLSRRVAIRNLC